MRQFFVVLAVILISANALASPFIVSDPYPTTVVQPTYFELTLDGGAAFNSTPLVQTDQSVILHYDVGPVSSGNHRLTVKACNVFGCSESVPFDFVKSVPAKPSGLRLSSQ